MGRGFLLAFGGMGVNYAGFNRSWLSFLVDRYFGYYFVEVAGGDIGGVGVLGEEDGEGAGAGCD